MTKKNISATKPLPPLRKLLPPNTCVSGWTVTTNAYLAYGYSSVPWVIQKVATGSGTITVTINYVPKQKARTKRKRQ